MNNAQAPRWWHPIAASLYLHDVFAVAFLQALSVLAIAVSMRLDAWGIIVIMNSLSTLLIVLIAEMDHRTHNVFLEAVHRYYIAIVIFAIFKEVYVLAPAVNPILVDDALIAIDHAMFGVHPTQWLQQFTHPALVEILQLCYSSFYFIMLGLVIELSVKRRDAEYEHYTSTIVYGFFLSYIGYLIWPAIGPRLTLHDFSALNKELPGLWATETLRAWINSGESISEHAANFLATAQRDAFPSGHTEMTLLTILCAWRFRATSRWWITAIGIGLIIGTVFLRYHYVVDVIGGMLFAAFTVATFPFIARWWQRVQRSAPSR